MATYIGKGRRGALICTLSRLINNLKPPSTTITQITPFRYIVQRGECEVVLRTRGGVQWHVEGGSASGTCLRSLAGYLGKHQ